MGAAGEITIAADANLLREIIKLELLLKMLVEFLLIFLRF